MPEVRQLFAATVAGLREESHDPLAATLERARRRRTRRRLAGAAVGLAAAGLAVLALSLALPGRAPVPAENGPASFPSYVVRVTSIEPAPPPNEGMVRLSYVSEWATSAFPGEASCLITGRDESGSVIWTVPVNWTTDARQSRSHVTVPEHELPATATIDCDPVTVGTPIEGSYSFNVTTVDITDRALVIRYDVRWDSGIPGRRDACDVRVALPNGRVLTQAATFEVLAASGLRLDFPRDELPADLTPDEAHSLPVTFHCRPFDGF
jgi:hypothetical protein